VKQGWQRPSSFILHVGWSLVMNGLLALLAFSDSSKAIKVNPPLQEMSSERSVDT
jgi:hypothetical protein